jgi:hypothetical protein
MHVYQMRSSIPSVVSATQERINLCMNALRDVSRVWLVAKMVHTLFESILGNKLLEERLQKATGKRHNKSKHTANATPPSAKKEEPQKRKFDEMDFGYTNGPPAPQLSYERSRPQTPAVTPSRELGHQHQTNTMNAPSQTSPQMRHTTDTFLSGGGNSRGNTRPTSPFNPSYSVPATPPDLYLVTRNSPPISQSLWENFQPDQLFPGGTDMNIQPFASPNSNTVDPQLQMPHMQTPQMQQQMMQGQPMSQNAMGGSQDSNAGMGMNPGMQGMPQMHGGMQNQVWPMQAFDSRMGSMDQTQSDNWSDSSRSQGPMVPATLNVEDWCVTFLLR